MKPIKVSPFEGAMNFLGTLASGNPYPDQQIRDTVNSITIDTCLPKDTMIWETGIERKKIEGKWVIVEQYPDEQRAKAGHTRWVKLMTEKPDYPLKDIDNWSLTEEF